jgi:hypothetical protein
LALAPAASPRPGAVFAECRLRGLAGGQPPHRGCRVFADAPPSGPQFDLHPKPVVLRTAMHRFKPGPRIFARRVAIAYPERKAIGCDRPAAVPAPPSPEPQQAPLLADALSFHLCPVGLIRGAKSAMRVFRERDCFGSSGLRCQSGLLAKCVAGGTWRFGHAHPGTNPGADFSPGAVLVPLPAAAAMVLRTNPFGRIGRTGTH